MCIRDRNVTVPHKQAVMKYLDSIDEAARDIGAVNTLVRTERGYKGYNTDVPGLRRAVQEAGFTVKGRDCLLIGAGGAARAAAYMLIRDGAESIAVLNRSVEKAEELAEYGNMLAGREMMRALALSQWKEPVSYTHLTVSFWKTLNCLTEPARSSIWKRSALESCLRPFSALL